MAESFACPDCGQSGDNSYWLLDHIENCIERWKRDQHPSRHHRRHHHRHEVREFQYTVSVPIPKGRKVHIHMADITLRDSDPPFSITVQLVDAQGAPTTPDFPVGSPGGPVWAESSGGTVIRLDTSDDGLTGTGQPVAPGTSNLTFTCNDANPDGSVGTPMVGTGTVTVNPGEAVSVELTFTPGSAPAPTPTPTP